MEKILACIMVGIMLLSSFSILVQRGISTPVITKRTYTSDADFDEGILIGVEHETVHDQLQLSREVQTFPYLWVPNEDDTVSKIDASTGRELARYRTGPEGFDGEPSRTTVDLRGSCWVANRYAGTVVKIGLYESNEYIDRNGNGLIDTSKDIDGDGDIDPDEILPWGQDECVLFEIVLIPGSEGTYAPGEFPGPYAHDWGYPGPRSIAVDANNNVWVGTWGSMKFYYIDGSSGSILKIIDVSQWNHHAYGAVIDSRGIIWSSGHQFGDILRLDTTTDPPTISQVYVGHFVYGLGLDYQGHLFASGWTDRKLTKINITANPPIIEWTLYKPEMRASRGVICTSDNDVWVANSDSGTVTRYDNEGNLKATIYVGNQPTGVGVDAYGKVWVTNLGDEYIKRIDPATNTIDLTKRIVGSGGHYTYSDFTGIVIRTITTKSGTWTVIFDSEENDTPWGRVSWSSFEPKGTAITVKVRSSNDKLSWSQWEDVTNGSPFVETPPGRYLQIEVTLKITSEDIWRYTPWITPILYDLTVETAIIQQPTEPYIEPPIVLPRYPIMGEDYKILITVVNPTDSAKSVTLTLTESDWAKGYDDEGNPNQQVQTQTKEIEAGGRQTFEFSYRHTWRWLKPLESMMSGPPAMSRWDIAWYIIGLLGYRVPVITEIRLLSELLIADELGLPSYTYNYKVSSNINSISADISVRVTVPYYKLTGFLVYLTNSYVGLKFTGIGILGVLAGAAGWAFLAGAAIMQAVLLASAATVFETAIGTPDLNYTEIAKPEPITITELEDLPESTIKRMAQDSLALLVDLRALTTTLQRYEGARRANDLVWMLGQCQAARIYTEKVIDDLNQLNASISNFLDEMESVNIVFDESDIQAMKDWIANNGLPEIEVEVLRRLGMSEEDILRLDDLLLQIPESVLINYGEGLTIFGDLTSIFKNQLLSLMADEEEIKSKFVEAEVNCNPSTLNLKSEGQWITAYIELPESYNVGDINVSSIWLNYTIPANLKPTAIGDYDNDTIPDLMVKFDRAKVIQCILDNINMTELLRKRFMAVTLTVTGYLNDGTPFKGSTTIRVRMPMPKMAIQKYSNSTSFFFSKYFCGLFPL